MFLRLHKQLEQALYAEGEETAEKGMPFIKALGLFDRIVNACFGMTLKPEYEQLILSFKAVYLELGITVTPKVNNNENIPI